MIIYIYGEDTYRSRQYLGEQVDRFKQARDPQGYNVTFLDAQKVESGRITSEILSSPFLAEKRLIVVENILSISDKVFLQELIERIKSNKIPESNSVIFWQGEKMGKVKEVKDLHALLAKEKYAQEFSLLEGITLSNWINTEIKKRNGKISGTAVNYLAQNSAGDMWFLHSLLDQLVAYSGDKEIGVADVNLFLDEKIDDNVFNMVEAIVSGNKKQAYKLIEEQRRLGEDDFKLFGLIVWQFRTQLAMRSLFDAEDNIGSDAMAKQLGLHPFVVKKNMGLIKRNSLKKLEEIYSELLQMDLKAKTGQGDLGLMLDLLIQKI
ncbi:MAG: DNA polymerase III, delta subunit [uncultured bacterium]|nr:MAG: DNA polymerase III, delta subunit [uncultured bacterium]